jgi:hypothetical protein
LSLDRLNVRVAEQQRSRSPTITLRGHSRRTRRNRLDIVWPPTSTNIDYIATFEQHAKFSKHHDRLTETVNGDKPVDHDALCSDDPATLNGLKRALEMQSGARVTPLAPSGSNPTPQHNIVNILHFRIISFLC